MPIRNHTASKLALAFLALSLGSTALAKGDIQPIALRFENVAATTGGEFPQPAHQRVVLFFKNIGNQAVGKLRAQVCPGIEDDAFCLNTIRNSIKGVTLNYQDAVLNHRIYTAGGNFHWEFSLPPNTLKQCQLTSVKMDISHTLGQSGFADVYSNDLADLKAIRLGALCPIVFLQDSQFEGGLDGSEELTDDGEELTDESL